MKQTKWLKDEYELTNNSTATINAKLNVPPGSLFLWFYVTEEKDMYGESAYWEYTKLTQAQRRAPFQ